MNTPAPIVALEAHILAGYDALWNVEGVSVVGAHELIDLFCRKQNRIAALEAELLEERLASAAAVDQLRNELLQARACLAGRQPDVGQADE